MTLSLQRVLNFKFGGLKIECTSFRILQLPSLLAEVLGVVQETAVLPWTIPVHYFQTLMHIIEQCAGEFYGI